MDVPQIYRRCTIDVDNYYNTIISQYYDQSTAIALYTTSTITATTIIYYIISHYRRTVDALRIAIVEENRSALITLAR